MTLVYPGYDVETISVVAPIATNSVGVLAEPVTTAVAATSLLFPPLLLVLFPVPL